MQVKENFTVVAEINVLCIQIAMLIIKAKCAISCHSGSCATMVEAKVVYKWYSRDWNGPPPSSSTIKIKSKQKLKNLYI